MDYLVEMVKKAIADHTWTNVIVSLVLASLFTLHEIACDRQGFDRVFFNILIFLHHFGKLFIWLSPFFVSNITLLTIIILLWGYVCVQNVVRTGDQPCILSNYVNKECGVHQDEPLRDIFFHLGIKTDMSFYNWIFNILSWILLGVLILKMLYIYMCDV